MKTHLTKTITLHGDHQTWTREIVAFSMLEPSVMHCEFITTDGTHLAAHGCNIVGTGLDDLPSVREYKEKHGSKANAVHG